MAILKKTPYVASKAAPKPVAPKAAAISTKVPTGMTAADYGKQIAQQVYGTQSPINTKPASSSGSGGGSSAGYGNYVNTYGNEGYANLIRAKEAAGQQLSDRSAADLFKANNPTLFGVQPIEQQQPQIQQPNLVDYARQQADQEQAAALAKMQAARAKATGELALQKQGVTPAYNQLRNQASASTMQAAQRLREIMAAQGLGQSGENVSAQVALGAQGGQALNDLNLQERARLNEIDQGIANVNNADEEAAIIAQLSAEKTKALMDATNRQADMDHWDKTFNEGVRQFDFSNSPSNPKVQGQLLENKVKALALAAQEIENSYLPQEKKMQAQLLAQKVKTGELDYPTALSQLNKIKAETAHVGDSAAISGARLGYDIRQDANKNAEQRVGSIVDQINNLYVYQPKDPMGNVTGQKTVDANSIKSYIKNLATSGQITESEAKRLLTTYGFSF